MLRSLASNKQSLITRSVRKLSMVSSPALKNPELLRSKCLVNGEWLSAKSGDTFDVHDPATGKLIAHVPQMSVGELKSTITHARSAFLKFRKTTNRERGRMLRKWSDLMLENQEDLAKILTWENGKPLAEARGEVMSSITNLEWFAEEAPRIYGDVIPSQFPNARIHTIKQPVGVCSIITPWNFPSSMIARKVGAAVAAGCTTVIKPADATPFSALAMAYLGEQAGIPRGVLNVLTVQKDVKEFGREMCVNPDVSKVTFTGSTGVGKVLMEQASSSVKKVSFELGGNAPFIVFDDADIDKAVQGAVLSKFRGSGQTCICANRFYVHEKVYDEFSAKFAKKIGEEMRLGHGFHDESTHGPLTNSASVEKVHRHVTDALSKKGKVLIGGKPRPDLGANFYDLTVLGDVTQDMIVTKEETFGPVAALIKFSTDDQVIEWANNTEVGLAAYFYSNDVTRVNRVSEALDVGMIGVNTGVITEVALPFGGVKQSGFGREGSKYGLDDYLVIKSVVTNLA